MKHRLIVTVLAAMAHAAMAGRPAHGQPAGPASGLWKLQEVTVSCPSGQEINPRYPWTRQGRPGDLTSEIGIGHLNPPGRQAVRLLWTSPPAELIPGRPVFMTLYTAMLANDTRGAAYISCRLSADIEAIDMPDGFVSREGRRPFAEGPRDHIAFSEKTPVGTVARLEARAVAPAFGELRSRESGQVQVRVQIAHQYLLTYHYRYRWVAASEPTGPIVPASRPVPATAPGGAPTAGARSVPSAESGYAAGDLLGGFPRDQLAPAEEEKTERIGPARGGTVALSDGARLTVPAGGVQAEIPLQLRRLRGADTGLAIYQIVAPVGELQRPAELALPVPAEASGEDCTVKVWHMHDWADPGRELPVTWPRSQPLARVEVRKLSLVMIGAALASAEALAKLANRDAALREAVRAVQGGALRIDLPHYYQGDTQWCWAACLAMVCHAVRSPAENIEHPLKPQVIASRVGAQIMDGLPVWRHLLGNSAEPFASLGADLGASFEIRRWFRYPAMMEYLLGELAAGHPVLVYTQSDAHYRAVVGFDADGRVLLHDPRSLEAVSRVPWDDFLAVLKNTCAQTWVGVWTTVLKKPGVNPGPLSLNVPSCAIGPKVPHEYNKYGCFFTAPHGLEDPLKHVGWRWWGFEPAWQGMLPSTGGEFKWMVDPVGVGDQTRFGFRGVHILNTSTRPVPCAVEVVLVDPADGTEIVLARRFHFEARGGTGTKEAEFPAGKKTIDTEGKSTRFDLKEEDQPRLLDLLPEGKRGIRPYVIRFRLFQDGQEVDRVNVPVRLHPLRIDGVGVTVEKGEKIYGLTGSGFRYIGVQGNTKDPKPVEAVLLPSHRTVPLAITDDGSASFSVPESVVERAVYFRAGDGLESNRHALPPETFRLALRHEGGAVLGPGNNILKVVCNGTLLGPAGTRAAARARFMHNAQLLDVYAATVWEEPLEISLQVQHTLSQGMTWQWDCTVPGHPGAAYGRTTLSNPRLVVIPNAPQHAGWKSTQPLPSLRLAVPTGAALAAQAGAGPGPQQFAGLVALVFDKKVEIYKIEVERQDGKVVGTRHVLAKEATEKFVRDQGTTATVYLLHFQVDRNP